MGRWGGGKERGIVRTLGRGPILSSLAVLFDSVALFIYLILYHHRLTLLFTFIRRNSLL